MPTPAAATITKRRRRIGASLAVAGAAAGTLAGCASIQRVEMGLTHDSMTVYQVAITRTALLPGTPAQAFAFITAEDVLPKVLTGYGPLPAVVKTSGNTGPWDQPGSARIVHLADQTTVREQVTRYASPEGFAYRVWDFGNPVVRGLASEARGEWTFTPVEGGTKVSWTYTFTAHNVAALLPLSGITQLLWRGYMDVCLENTKRLLGSTLLAAVR